MLVFNRMGRLCIRQCCAIAIIYIIDADNQRKLTYGCVDKKTSQSAHGNMLQRSQWETRLG
jgi:hypothetical protein